MADGAGVGSALWLAAAVATAAAATYAWRGLGVLLAGRIRVDGAAFAWIGYVAYGLLAGLIARMILLPAGPLATTALGVRLAATGVALAVFFAAGRHLVAGVVAGVVAFTGLVALGVG